MARKTEESAALRVYLEEGSRRTFAMALDWPGWGRSGRDAETALETLITYRARYDVVATAAGLGPIGSGGGDRGTADGADSLDVVARVPGNATTEFGAPGVVPPLDGDGWTPPEARRQCALLAAAWARFDEIVAGAPAELRKGPRGGGRDRDKIVDHVLSTEPAYARKAGLRLKAPSDRAGLDELRAQLLAQLASSDGRATAASGWPAPYAVRRIAWHALDHAWEIEDRSHP